MKTKQINWLKPVTTQWPLMLAYVVMIGWASVTKNPIPRWFVIFLHAYIVAGVVTITCSRIVKALIYGLIYLLFIIEIVLEWMFGMSISPNVLVLMAETNTRESMEFFDSLLDKPQLWQIVLCVAGILMANIYVELMRPCINQWVKRWFSMRVLQIIVALLLVSGTLFSYSYIKLLACDEMNQVDEWRSHMRNPDDLATKLLVAVWDIHLLGKEIDHVAWQAEHINIVTQSETVDSLNIIFIIGESFIREHSPLYGYPLATTPFLSEEQQAGRLFAFTDVVSPYNQTTRVIRNLLCCNSLGDGEDWFSSPPLTAVFKKNGYRVSMFDNQKTSDTGQVFAFSLNTFLYHPRMLATCYQEVNDSTFEYDGQLVDYHQRHLPTHPVARQLIVYHLMGQHISFNCRYPKGYDYFTADSIHFRKEPWLTPDMKTEIAYYDNATRYNDDVIRQLTSLYKDQTTVMVYFSDHGEEVYDYRDSYGRDDWSMGSAPRQVLRYQYMVPFVVWCSDKYLRQYPEMAGQLRQSIDKPLMLDNVCHLLFHLAHLQTPYYKARRDVLSPDYSCPKRLINDQMDYNEIMSGND
jgi:heptose-I-phosphate ethanolaminephosphotransferase